MSIRSSEPISNTLAIKNGFQYTTSLICPYFLSEATIAQVNVQGRSKMPMVRRWLVRRLKLWERKFTPLPMI